MTENTAVGSSVARLEASDDDIGANARLLYSLTSLSVDAPTVLDVDPDSGDVFVAGSLDFENSGVELEYTRRPGRLPDPFRRRTSLSTDGIPVQKVKCQIHYACIVGVI